jgi:diguanylate cyclase (GGDEF)-like protein
MKTENENSARSWQQSREELAEQSGLAIIIADNLGVCSASNDNSICRAMNSSAEFAPRCTAFCGSAFEMTNESGEAVELTCHAGLHYNAVPLVSSDNRKLVGIVGRTFVRSEDYRRATERMMDGDWKEFDVDEMFGNVLLAGSESEILKVSKQLQKLSDSAKIVLEAGDEKEDETKQMPAEIAVPAEQQTESEPTEKNEIARLLDEFQKQKETHEGHETSDSEKSAAVIIERSDERHNEEFAAVAAWRSLFSSLLELDYREAFISVAEFIGNRFSVENLAWLENKNGKLEGVWSTGSFAGQSVQVSIGPDDTRFREVLAKETSLELRERGKSVDSGGARPTVNLFPISLGGTIRSALMIGDPLTEKTTKRQIARFLKHLNSDIEILRLRDEIKQQAWLTKSLQKLNQTLKRIDSDDFWSVLAQNSAELMRAERGSIMIFDEETEGFVIKAAVGTRSDIIEMMSSEHLGDRIAANVLRSGRPLVVEDTAKAGIPPAPAEWKYKTDSFISYPIIIGGRKIGVINLTDKIGGGIYDDSDLEILNTFAPQIALALDRTSFKTKAGEYEQLSITDPLTGLLNRRYLEERLAEELSRSQRHGYPMSFLMIDVDSFKSYNDTFGHTEGDKALQLVGQNLKATLRGADVAARFGGEEFSILLPQTTLNEALTIAERIRQRVESARFPNRQVTVSIGIATCSKELNETSELIAAADKALYEAKNKGRNNVQLYKISRN